jgi:vacuolar-type H+-ATPase subunit H
MPVFTESKKGYNRDEVNNFIKQQNEAHEATIAEKDKRIKELEDEVRKLSKNASATPAPVETPPSEDLSEIKKKYERLCADMGEKLLLAEVKASEIVDDANKKADLIIAEARIKANDQVTAILEDSKKSSEGIKKAIAEYSAMGKEISALLSTTEETFKKALERISSNIYNG